MFSRVGFPNLRDSRELRKTRFTTRYFQFPVYACIMCTIRGRCSFHILFDSHRRTGGHTLHTYGNVGHFVRIYRTVPLEKQQKIENKKKSIKIVYRCVYMINYKTSNKMCTRGMK